MNNQEDLKTIKNKAIMNYHKDGIIDLLFGLMMIGYGLFLYFDQTALMVVSWLPIFLFQPIKNLVTVPRMGYVQFESDTEGRKKYFRIMLLGIITLVFFLFLYTFTANGSSDFLDSFLSNSIGVIFGLMFSLLMILLGWVMTVPRMFLHALISAIIFILGRLMDLDIPITLQIAGAVTSITGASLLFGFLQKYPLDKLNDNQ